MGSLLWTSVDCSYLDHKILHNSDMKLLLFAFFTSALGQLKFGGSSNSGSSADKDDTNTKNSDTKIFTGNEALDGGLVGAGLGLVGGSILSGLLNSNNNNPCGRRRRQAEGTNTKFLGVLLGGGGSNGCNCGRRKRQAPGENKPGTRFFGLDTLLGGGGNNNCGCNCGYNNGYNNGYTNGVNNGGSNNGYNSGYNTGNSGFNSGNTQQRCQCNYNLTFRDQYGNTHGACRRADETGRTWCYTTGGYGCSDARSSKRFPNNPWSYQACGNQG